MTVEQLPSSYKYGKVVGRIVHAVADTPEDEDAYPQARGARGTVNFSPIEKFRRVQTPGETALVMHEPVECSLSSTGRIIDAEGRIGVWLIQGTWIVAFNLDGGSVDSFEITVGPEHTDESPLDLAKV